MTVEPGFGGQKFMAQHVSKNQTKAEWKKKELGLGSILEVDGGVTLDNVREVLDAGANVIVAGSAVFGKEDIAGARQRAFWIFLRSIDNNEGNSFAGAEIRDYSFVRAMDGADAVICCDGGMRHAKALGIDPDYRRGI